MSKKVVFIGNCQAGGIKKIYSDIVKPFNQDQVSYIPSYVPSDTNALKLIDEADIIALQILDFIPQNGDLKWSAPTVYFPMLSANYLWPCSGKAHPNSVICKHLGEFPYGPELGNSSLDRLSAKKRLSSEQIAVEYLLSDIVKLRHVERMRDIVIDRQRKRDRCGDYDFFTFISQHISHEKLFRSPNHPNIALMSLLASNVFERMNVSSDLLSKVLESKNNVMPATEAPIHPSVAKFLGLSYVQDSTKFRFFEEGDFNVLHYAKRYIDHVWSPNLAYGISLAQSGDSRSIEILNEALLECPNSAVGRFMLSGCLQKIGDLNGALRLVTDACFLAPNDKIIQNRYSEILSILSSNCESGS